MIQKIDSAMGRFIYSRRMGLIEPVFGNIRHALGLDRFTLKGKGEGQHPVEALQHGAQSFKDIPLRMDHSDGPERIESDGGIEKTLSTQSTRKDGNRWKEGLEIMLNGS
jgi:hypothetical protein